MLASETMLRSRSLYFEDGIVCFGSLLLRARCMFAIWEVAEQRRLAAVLATIVDVDFWKRAEIVPGAEAEAEAEAGADDEEGAEEEEEEWAEEEEGEDDVEDVKEESDEDEAASEKGSDEDAVSGASPDMLTEAALNTSASCLTNSRRSSPTAAAAAFLPSLACLRPFPQLCLVRNKDGRLPLPETEED